MRNLMGKDHDVQDVYMSMHACMRNLIGKDSDRKNQLNVATDGRTDKIATL